MTTFPEDETPQCVSCLWLFEVTLTHEPPLRCAAYPDAIPDEIADAEVGHDELRGDESVELAFEPKE